MSFLSIHFMVFMALVLVGTFSLPQRARRWLLLAASYYFYGVFSVPLISLLLFSTLLDYTAALRIDRSPDPAVRRRWLWASLVGNLGLLALFKYLGFFTETVNVLLELTGLPELVVVRLILPMGISFYAFQTMSYTIDVYNGATKACDDVVDVALYVAFFPQLVAGPIMRSDALLPQFRQVHQPNLDRILSGALLMVWGMVKKAYIADPVARVVNEAFAEPSAYSGLALLVAVYGFAIQIYCDFSAYSDIARGAGRCLGFEVMVNFDTPYLSSSLREFWRRWHISLSTWLRDYLYIPLGGNRHGTVYTYRNLMITMLLGGLWHGASWNFVIWGALHGGGLAVERALRLHSVGGKGVGARLVRGVVVFHFVCLSWVFFRAETLPISLTVVQRIVTGAAGASVSWLPAGMLIALLVGSAWLRGHNRVLAFLERHEHAGRWTVYVLALLLASLFARQTAPDFIYFQF